MELIYKKDASHAVLHNTGDAAVAAVENIKAVDAVPVVHWEWVRQGADCWRCSVCGTMTDDYGNYCPNCGAKIDGGLITMEQAVVDCLKSLGLIKGGETDERTD